MEELVVVVGGGDKSLAACTKPPPPPIESKTQMKEKRHFGLCHFIVGMTRRHANDLSMISNDDDDEMRDGDGDFGGDVV